MSSTKVTPAGGETRPASSPTPRQRKRRLSFADEYDGGKLEDTIFAKNLHYSKEEPPKNVAGGPGKDAGGGGGGGGCCVIS